MGHQMGFDKRTKVDAGVSLPAREVTLYCPATRGPPPTYLVGAGVLGLPYTFMRTGWLTSLLIVSLVALLTFHCMMLLIHIRKKLEDPLPASSLKLPLSAIWDSPSVAPSADSPLTPWSFSPKLVSALAISFSSVIPSPASSVPPLWGVSAKSVYIWGCFPFLLGLNSITSLTHLAPLSIFADIVDLGAMGVVLVDDFIIFSKQMPVVEAFGTPSTFFYGLGVAVYSFEGIRMCLPLESEMKDKPKFGMILGLTMVFIAAMYGGFGAMGYFAYGNNTKDIITATMCKGLLSTLVQLGLCINLFFTFPWMMNPVYEVFERRFWEGKYCVWIRWILVLAVSLFELFVPNFADFLSLVDSSTCCVLGFVLPSLFHYLTFKDEMSRRKASVDLGIIVMGVFLGVSGTWYSLVQVFSVVV